MVIVGVGAARLALLVGVDAMSISECHAMSWSMAWHHGMEWHGMPIGIPASAVHVYFNNSFEIITLFGIYCLITKG